MKIKAKVSKGGKIAIPSSCRKKLNIKEGSELIFTVKNGEMTVTPINLILEKARKTLRKYVKENVSLVDELLDERKKESENE